MKNGVHLPLSQRWDPEVGQKHQGGWEMSARNVQKVTKTYLTIVEVIHRIEPQKKMMRVRIENTELFKKVTRLWVSSFTGVLYHSVFGRVAAPGFFLHRDRK